MASTIDMLTEMPLDALELVQDFGREVILIAQCIKPGPDPDKPWAGRGTVPDRTEYRVRMAFPRSRKQKSQGDRYETRTRIGYIAARDPGLQGYIPTDQDLVLDPAGSCEQFGIELVEDWDLETPIVYILTLVTK